MRNRFLPVGDCVDSVAALCFDAGVKFFLLVSALALLVTSCTTLSNRRDLYNPSEDAGNYNSLKPARPSTPGNPGEREEPLPPPAQ